MKSTLQFKVFKCTTLQELTTEVNAWLSSQDADVTIHSQTFQPKRRDESNFYVSFVFSCPPKQPQ